MTSTVRVHDCRPIVDEVGIRSLRCGDWHLKTALQPVYRRQGGRLELAALRAFVLPFEARQRRTAAEFLKVVAPEERGRIDALLVRLHVGNRGNAGVANPDITDLWIEIDASRGEDDALRQIAAAAEAADDGAQHVTCLLSGSAVLGGAGLRRLAFETRARGMGIGADAVGVELGDMVPLDLVHLRGGLFRDLARVRKAPVLIRTLIEAWRSAGARVLIEGVETQTQLGIALDSGATHVDGYLLGLPQLAGLIIDDAPVSMATFAEGFRGAAAG